MNMKIDVAEEKENKFFKRKDLKVSIDHADESTPSIETIKKELSTKYNVDPAQVVVDYVFSKSGLAESFAKVKILNEKPKVEAPKEGPKPEEAASPAETPSPAAETPAPPAETPKEESPKEEAPEPAQSGGESSETQVSEAE